MAKSIVNVTNEVAKNYFLQNMSYFNIEMPEYFNFSKMLKEIDKYISKLNSYMDCIDGNNKPDQFEDTTYSMYMEKKGKYQWRNYKLLNPYLYVALVREITEKENWKKLVERYTDLTKEEKIECCSMIMVSSNSHSNKSVSIRNWFNRFEQQTIELSSEFRYMAITDITNCYSSVYTHSIDWAIEGKGTSKKLKNKSNTLGHKIDHIIQILQYGQTNGLPEGNKVSEFLAEFVLADIDKKLGVILKKLKVIDYKILRYRDDYHIFSNNKDNLIVILNNLTKVLQEYGMRLNKEKTKMTDNILNDTLKKDKEFQILYDIKISRSIQKDIFAVWKFNELFPDSGRVSILLDEFYKKYIKNLRTVPKSYNQILAYVVDMLYKTTRNYGICVVILTSLLSINKNDREKWISIIKSKFKYKPNTEYCEIWMQRLTIGFGMIEDAYESKLCQFVNSKIEGIWNFSWIKEKSRETIIKYEKLMIDDKKMKSLSKKIPFELFELIDEYN